MTCAFLPPGSPVKNALYGLMKVIVPCCLTACYRIEVIGRDNLPDVGPAIILPKHQYWTDIPLVGLAFSGTQLNYIAKQELFRFPLISRFLMGLGGIPLDREAPIKSKDSFRHLADLLKKGERVVLFPEGTYYRGVMGRGKSRLIGMILKFQERNKYPTPVPFIPVGIVYGREKLRKRVTIAIGTPLYAQQADGVQTFTRSVMEAIARLSELEAEQQKHLSC
jgi:1-acyl-sn-glycerol-3-phosphate acyltransferase